jgi:16S rRNA (guanine527-N7)-methyltransferase
VTARAVAPLEKLKKISWHLLKTNGSLLAMKGEKAQEEMKSVPKATLHEVNLEGIELSRIVEVRKGA